GPGRHSRAAMLQQPGDGGMAILPDDGAMTTLPGDGAMTTLPGDSAMTTLPGDGAMATLPNDGGVVRPRRCRNATTAGAAVRRQGRGALRRLPNGDAPDDAETGHDHGRRHRPRLVQTGRRVRRRGRAAAERADGQARYRGR